MSEEKREFKGIWIKKDLWLNAKLSAVEKCLLAEIDSLDHGGGCWASNEYLGKFLHTTPGRTANMISKLRKLGHIKDVHFDGRKRWVKAVFTPKLKQTSPQGEGSSNPEVKKAKSLDQSIDKKEREEASENSTSKPLSPSTKPLTPVPLAPSPSPDSQLCESIAPKPPPPPPCPEPSGKPPAPATGQPRKPSKGSATWLTPYDDAWFARSGGHLPFATVSRGFKQFHADHGDLAMPWWQNFCLKAPRDEFHTVHSFLRNPAPWKPKSNTRGSIAATEKF